MRESDFGPFAQLLDEVWQLKGQTLQTGAKALWFRALAAHPLEAVRSALGAHLSDPERGRFLPMPADILAQLERFDGRPGAEEAWAIAVRGQDEAETIVWTSEAAEAFGIARSILEAGDEVGARMAFREAYERLVLEARKAHRPVRWQASLGDDVRRRDMAIREAIGRGLLERSELPCLPAPRGSVPQLELPADPDARARAVAGLMALREWLTSPADGLESPDAVAKRRTVELARESARRVAEAVGPEALQ